MRRPPFQFTIQAALGATFWMAVCCGAVVANRNIPPAWEFHDSLFLWRALGYSTFYIGILSPFIALGALIGRTWMGAITGFIATSALIAVVSLFVLLSAAAPWPERNQWITTMVVHLVMVAAGIGLFAGTSRAGFARSRSAVGRPGPLG